MIGPVRFASVQFTQSLLDDGVVGQSLASLVDFAKATLVDELAN